MTPAEAKTISRRTCKNCSWLFDDPLHPEPWPRGYCCAHCWKAAKKPTKAPEPPRTPISRSKAGERPRRAVSVASVAQRAKRGACIVTGATEGVDAAHVTSRALGGCSAPECVIGLRRDLHRQFDEHDLDVLPHMLAHGMWAELAHPIAEHQVDPIRLVERLTGCRVVLVPKETTRGAGDA